MTHSGFRDLILTPLWRRVCLKKHEIDHFASFRAKPFLRAKCPTIEPELTLRDIAKVGLGLPLSSKLCGPWKLSGSTGRHRPR